MLIKGAGRLELTQSLCTLSLPLLLTVKLIRFDKNLGEAIISLLSDVQTSPLCCCRSLFQCQTDVNLLQPVHLQVSSHPDENLGKMFLPLNCPSLHHHHFLQANGEIFFHITDVNVPFLCPIKSLLCKILIFLGFSRWKCDTFSLLMMYPDF